MSRKNVILMIVEGPSDEMALGVPMKAVFQNNKFMVYVVHGDITSERDSHPDNIVAKVGNRVKQFLKIQKFKHEDMERIIHIMDTDGVYIPEANIVYSENVEKVIYKSEGIYTSNVDGIIRRNKHKKANVARLAGEKSVMDIPYAAYYMSANLDHVLYDQQNSSDKEKQQNAAKFAIKYKNDAAGFVKFMRESDFAVVTDYKSSWKYIAEGLNSVNRHTNLGLALSVNGES